MTLPVTIEEENLLIKAAQTQTPVDETLLNKAIEQNPDITKANVKSENTPTKRIKLKKGDRKKIQVIEQKFLQILKELIVTNKKLSETSLQYQEVKRSYESVKASYTIVNNTINLFEKKMKFIESKLGINLKDLLEIQNQAEQKPKEEIMKAESNVNISSGNK